MIFSPGIAVPQITTLLCCCSTMCEPTTAGRCTSARAAYALLKSGVFAKDPVVRKSIDYLKYQPYAYTYAVAVEICAFDAYGEKSVEDPLLAGAKWLEAQQRKDGLWGYPDKDEDL